MDEVTRIKEVYTKRDAEGKGRLYSLLNLSALFLHQQRERSLLVNLRKYGMDDLGTKLILDIGCGKGGVLRDFIRYGAIPRNLSGIDILPDRIEKAREISPNIDFKCCDATSLPYEGEAFDIVLQFTVFTSILERKMKEKVAGEMLRVLKPDGIIIWYDYHMDNPLNPDVKGVNKNEISGLFSGCEIHLEKITLAPPVTRLIAPYSWLLCIFLEKLKLLNTHYFGIIKKRRK